MKPEALISKLRTIEANAMETARQAAIAIRELEGVGQKKPRKKGGLTAEDIHQIRVSFQRSIMRRKKRQQALTLNK